MSIVVLGAVFVDIKGYPISSYIPGGRNAGRVVQVHGGVSRNIVEDIANVELRPTFVSLVDESSALSKSSRATKSTRATCAPRPTAWAPGSPSLTTRAM